jgi:hypothetical protein
MRKSPYMCCGIYRRTSGVHSDQAVPVGHMLGVKRGRITRVTR